MMPVWLKPGTEIGFLPFNIAHSLNQRAAKSRGYRGALARNMSPHDMGPGSYKRLTLRTTSFYSPGIYSYE